MKIKSRIGLRRAAPTTVESSTVLVVLSKGDTEVYRVELPTEVARDEDGLYVALSPHERSLGEDVTWDGISIQARYRRRDV